MVGSCNKRANSAENRVPGKKIFFKEKKRVRRSQLILGQEMSMTTVDNLEKNNHSSDWRVFNADDFS
jgi:hypothetical protein